MRRIAAVSTIVVLLLAGTANAASDKARARAAVKSELHARWPTLHRIKYIDCSRLGNSRFRCAWGINVIEVDYHGLAKTRERAASLYAVVCEAGPALIDFCDPGTT